MCRAHPHACGMVRFQIQEGARACPPHDSQGSAPLWAGADWPLWAEKAQVIPFFNWFRFGLGVLGPVWAGRAQLDQVSGWAQ